MHSFVMCGTLRLRFLYCNCNGPDYQYNYNTTELKTKYNSIEYNCIGYLVPVECVVFENESRCERMETCTL